MKEKKTIIEVKKLSKIYNKGKHNEVIAIDNINFKVNEGEFVAIMGPSGSGKSTLLHLIGALDTPTKGDVFIDDVAIKNLDENNLANIRLKKIGFIFQTFNLIPGVSALDNVTIPLVPYGLSGSREKYAKHLLNGFGIGARANHDPNELSGGEKQRVAIARSLINNPKIILADEPTGQLDTKTGRGIIRLMRELNHKKKLTFIIVTHDESLLKYVERVIRLKDGKIYSDLRNGKVHKI